MILLKITFNYRKLRQTVVIYITFILVIQLFLLCAADLILQALGKHLSVFRKVLIFNSHCILSMFVSQTILLMLTIKQRFGALNYFLETKDFIKPNQLKTISRIHLKITKIIDEMNKTYSLMAMFFIAAAFCQFNLFLFCIKAVIVSFNYETFFIFISRSLLNGYACTFTMIIVVIASQTTKEARRTTAIIFERIHYMDDNDREMKSVAQNFVQQIAFCQTKFSCGLFDFDWPLCFKVNLWGLV